jgi:hypothetical protein
MSEKFLLGADIVTAIGKCVAKPCRSVCGIAGCEYPTIAIPCLLTLSPQGQVDAQHFLAQEQQRTFCLILGAGGNFSCYGKIA